MKKALKIVVPLVLTLAIIASIGWYLFVYDRDFTRDMLLQQARKFDTQGNTELASWFYDRAYEYTGQDQHIAIELANQYKADGNYTKAEYTLTNAIADGATVELYVALCRTFVEQDKLLDAVNLLDTIVNPVIRGQLDAIRPEAPVPQQEPGFYTQYIPVNLKAENGTLYCTNDGTYPSTSSGAYTEPFILPAGETTVSAIIVADNGLVSPLAVFEYTVGGVIEPVNFTDPAIAASVRQMLKADEDDVIYTNDLWDVEEYTIPAEAKQFEDLRYFPYLKKLTATDISFDTLAHLSELKDLEELTLTGCKIPNEDLALIAQLPLLTKLTLSNCGLSTIAALESAQNLTLLDLSNNAVRNLDALSATVSLRELYLQHNAIMDLSALSNLSHLEVLDVSYNSLTTLAPLATCTGLNKLNAGNNALTSLTGLENMNKLTALDVQANDLKDIYPLAGCTEMVELNLSGNELVELRALAAMTKLEILDFSYNQVEGLPAWPTNCALYSINGSYNVIASIDGLAKMPELAYVYMDYNELTDITSLANCHHLVMVNVYGNEISEVSSLTEKSIIVNYDPT